MHNGEGLVDDEEIMAADKAEILEDVEVLPVDYVGASGYSELVLCSFGDVIVRRRAAEICFWVASDKDESWFVIWLTKIVDAKSI